MVRLKLTVYPGEFGGMISYLYSFRESRKLPLSRQTVGSLVLTQYLDSFRPERLHSWSRKDARKAHALSLPLPVAKVLHTAMPYSTLNSSQQDFLNKLDYAVTNYQNPYAEAHVLGELIRLEGY